MAPLATLTLCTVVAALFGWAVPLERLLSASQSISASLSIIAAALLVRLNRTMPSLEWKSIEPERRRNLTQQIVFLTREYMFVLVIVGVLVVGLVSLVITGDEVIFGRRDFWTDAQLTPGWPDVVRRILSGLLGFGFALTLVRMGYVVWRDYDIAKLQKAIIDAAAGREQHDEQVRAAEDKVAAIRNAGLRSGSGASPRTWEG